MRWLWLLEVAALCSFSTRTPLLAQSGIGIFRSNCAFCHGIDARGGRGPSLVSTRVTQGTTDEALVKIVSHGIPGTEMPGFELEKDDLNALIGYIRQLGGTREKTVDLHGNAEHGRVVYGKQGCASCHRVGEAGGIYGPELTRIGSSRSADYLRESVTNPSADISPDFEGVTVITIREGTKISGIRVNEDTFSIQLRLPSEKFVMFDKASLSSVVYLKDSLMPSYKNLTANDLDDLVSYLASLRGDSSGADVRKAKGIH